MLRALIRQAGAVSSRWERECLCHSCCAHNQAIPQPSSASPGFSLNSTATHPTPIPPIPLSATVILGILGILGIFPHVLHMHHRRTHSNLTTLRHAASSPERCRRTLPALFRAQFVPSVRTVPAALSRPPSLLLPLS